MCLSGKVAIITGASSGIGAATAILFSNNRASLALHGRNVNGLDETIVQCEPANRDKIIKVVGDVTNVETLKNLVDETVKKFGRIDILVRTIVNVSSLSGSRSLPNFFGYGVSKAGMDQFTKQAALELAPKGIRVNSVNPGVTMTNGLRAGIPSAYFDSFIDNVNKIYPLGRAGDADEVAKAIFFLASAASSFITGEVLHVDGGLHAVTPS